MEKPMSVFCVASSRMLSTLPPVTSAVALAPGRDFDSTFAIAPPIGYHTPPVPPVEIVSRSCCADARVTAQQAMSANSSRFMKPPPRWSPSPRAGEGRDGGYSTHAIVLEPRQRAFPAIVGLRLAIARAVIGVKRVRRVGIQVDVRLLVRSFERLVHALDGVVRDARVRAAVEPE